MLYCSRIWKRGNKKQTITTTKNPRAIIGSAKEAFSIPWFKKSRHLVVLSAEFLTVAFFYILEHLSIFCVWVFVCMCLCEPQALWCLWRSEGGILTPWTWSYQGLWTIMWVLVTKPGSSSRVARASNHWAVSPAPARVASQFWVGAFYFELLRIDLLPEANAHSISFVTCRWKTVFKCQMATEARMLL